ncbi:MAG TPA: TRAM domain-containing protein [Gemmatimonadaceae bacterium]|nr:TRAM domain-containing protein [Gemmatimonadaceae bacterium]
MTQLLSLDVESIAAGGDGIARHDGLVVFVPRTAPGDRVAALVEQKGRLARGILQRVERPAPERVTPECPHYEGDQCGGCQLQHLSLVAQREAKRRIVADSFRRIGRREVPLPDLRTDNKPWRYRSKLTLGLRRTRGRWIAGLHPLGDPGGIFILNDCLIADERLMVVWREIMAAARYFPNADVLRGAVRLYGSPHSAAGLVLEGARDWGTHADFFASTPSLAALWWTPDGGARRLLHDRGPRGPDHTSGASFAQVNRGVAALLQAFVIGSVVAYAPRTVVDAYSGAGDSAVALAKRGIRVTTIELDPDASAYARARLPAGSRALTARVEDGLGAALPADVVILNPPRAGVDPRVTARLRADGNVRAIVYVSCDPATLARDVARLPAWRVARVTAFDMFPQTAHVETVCELVPEHAG